MSATFDPALSTDRDLVRALIGDTDVSQAQILDETIDALIAAHVSRGASASGAPYGAAADAGEQMAAKWSADSRGIAQRTVSKLTVRRAEGQSLTSAYKEYLQSLRARCTDLSLSAPSVIKSW